MVVTPAFAANRTGRALHRHHRWPQASVTALMGRDSSLLPMDEHALSFICRKTNRALRTRPSRG